MLEFININGPIEADTVYRSNKLVAKDVEFTLPEVAAIMADVEAMGTMSFPLWSRIDNMEYSIIKIGLDLGLASMLEPKLEPLEFRFVQSVIDANGNVKSVGCKAFIKGINTTIPGIGVVTGEASESELTQMATRYQLFVDGKEMFLIDRLAGIVRINGKDYSSGAKNLL